MSQPPLDEQIPLRTFENLSALVRGLRDALREGKGITFHNDCYVIARQQLPGFDAVLVCMKGTSGELNARFDERSYSGYGLHPHSFFPYDHQFISLDPSGKYIQTSGCRFTFQFTESYLASLRIMQSTDNLGSRYGPRVGTLRFIEKGVHLKERLSLEDEVRYCLA